MSEQQLQPAKSVMSTPLTARPVAVSIYTGNVFARYVSWCLTIPLSLQIATVVGIRARETPGGRACTTNMPELPKRTLMGRTKIAEDHMQMLIWTRPSPARQISLQNLNCSSLTWRPLVQKSYCAGFQTFRQLCQQPATRSWCQGGTGSAHPTSFLNLPGVHTSGALSHAEAR